MTVPYSSLTAAYNNTGISDNSDVAAANYDGVGDSYSAQALAAGTPTALTPGKQVTIGGTTFTWPSAAPGTPDNVVTGGQTVALSGSGTDLGFLGASQNGTASGTVTVHYTDGSSQSFNLNMADWYANSPAVGNQLLTTTTSWNFTSTTQTAHPVSIYFASVPLQAGKQVSSVTLPVLNNAGGTTAMHIFAMATGTGTPTTGAPYSSLAAAYDNVGITDNANPAPGNFDGTGESFSAQALAAGTPTPLTAGGQATFGGTTFTWPTAVGTPNNVIADGQTIDLSGSGTDLGFLGAGAFGAASGTGTITYTDGTTQSYSLVMADWYNNAPVAGDEIATTTTSWNFTSTTQTAHPVSIYFASVPLQAGKTVASVTLPTVSAASATGSPRCTSSRWRSGPARRPSAADTGRSLRSPAPREQGTEVPNGPRASRTPARRMTFASVWPAEPEGATHGVPPGAGIPGGPGLFQSAFRKTCSYLRKFTRGLRVKMTIHWK